MILSALLPGLASPKVTESEDSCHTNICFKAFWSTQEQAQVNFSLPADLTKLNGELHCVPLSNLKKLELFVSDLFSNWSYWGSSYIHKGERTKANKILGSLKEEWPLVIFLRARVTMTLADGREGMRKGESIPWWDSGWRSIISNADHVSSSPQVNLRERDACKTWNSFCSTHKTKRVLEITSRLTLDQAVTVSKPGQAIVVRWSVSS